MNNESYPFNVAEEIADKQRQRPLPDVKPGPSKMLTFYQQAMRDRAINADIQIVLNNADTN